MMHDGHAHGLFSTPTRVAVDPANTALGCDDGYSTSQGDHELGDVAAPFELLPARKRYYIAAGLGTRSCS
jgi:hypothetical protein